MRAGVASLAADGIPEKLDQNGPWEDGVFAQKVALDDQFRRVSTSLGWLTPAVRDRPNLTILTGVPVRRIAFRDGRAVGVFARMGERETLIGGRETILSAGALQSPALLMRSGIGPGPHLQERGIEILRHRPGVGRNLMEHPYAGLAFHLPRGARTGAGHHHIPVIWRFSSGLDGCPPGDMHLGFMGAPPGTRWDGGSAPSPSGSTRASAGARCGSPPMWPLIRTWRCGFSRTSAISSG